MEYGSSPELHPALQMRIFLLPRCISCGSIFVFEIVKMLRFSEEKRQIGREGIEHGDQLCPGFVVADEGDIFVEIAELELTHPLGEPGFDEFLLAFVEVNSSEVFYQRTDLLELIVGNIGV